MMSRKNAFLIHFCLSLLIVSTCIAIIFLVWYPGFYFHVFSTASVVKVLISVDLVVGPMLTLLLYKPGKPGLRFDLCVIGLIQLTALFYGMNIAYTGRPVVTVFAVDRFEVLTSQEVDFAGIDPLLLEDRGWFVPPLVVARLPADQEERNRLLDETLFEGKPDIQKRPEYWHAYSAAWGDVLVRAQPLQKLLSSSSNETKLRQQFESDAPGAELVYVPIMGRQEVFSLVLNASTGIPVGLVDQDPWGAKKVLETDT